MNRTLVLYDHLHHRGGAELVTQQLADQLGDADLMTALDLVYGRTASSRLPELVGKTAFWPTHHFAKLLPFLLQHDLKPRTIQRLQAQYHTVIASGFYSLPLLDRLHLKRKIYYCHGVPTFAYPDSHPDSLLGWGLGIFGAKMRAIYEKSLGSAFVVANSQYTARWLKDHSSIVAQRTIYPPVDVDDFCWRFSEGYFLSTARLENFKRVDAIIEAFRRRPEQQLVVAGWGSVGKQLVKQAARAPNIRFVGWVTRLQMRDLISRCRATIYLPRDEPFGISPVESMAAGKPVIGADSGGLRETILPDVTGHLLSENDLQEALGQAIEALTEPIALAMKAACERQAQRFAAANFHHEMRCLRDSDDSECGD